SVVWRTHLPTRTGGRVTPKEIEAFFEAAPPHASEVLETETTRVLEWLTSRPKALVKGPNPTESTSGPTIGDGDVIAVVLSASGDWRASLTPEDCLFEDDDTKVNKGRKEALKKRLAGATLIVHARCAG